VVLFTKSENVKKGGRNPELDLNIFRSIEPATQGDVELDFADN